MKNLSILLIFIFSANCFKNLNWKPGNFVFQIFLTDGKPKMFEREFLFKLSEINFYPDEATFYKVMDELMFGDLNCFKSIFCEN